MQGRWVKRKQHPRRKKGGGYGQVAENWAFFANGNNATVSYRHPCPDCGVRIVSVRMPNGGWAHFEGADGLSSVKHPCLDRGGSLSRRRDDETIDLFE